MDKAIEYYIERMGYMPVYVCPEWLDADAEFEYYKFSVPRLYIKEHIAEGGVWPHDVDINIVGTQDASVVLGVAFLPVYTGVEYLTEDDDFLYYKVRVPKVYLDSFIPDSNKTYRQAYEPKEEPDILECEGPIKAGAPLSDAEELEIVRKVKESKPLLWEIFFRCSSCGEDFGEVETDLFDALYARSCPVCANTLLDLVSCEILLEED